MYLIEFVLFFQIARWSRLWKLIQDGECEACSDLVIDPLGEHSDNQFDQKVKKFLMDRSILKVHLPNGGFNMVKYGDATDVKVNESLVISVMTMYCYESRRKYLF